MALLPKNLVLKLHTKIIEKSGGSHGVRDDHALDSCLEQPLSTFGGQDLYPSQIDKGAAIGFFLIANHPFIDGNKRIGLIAMKQYLAFHKYYIEASIDTQESIILAVASGEMDRETFTKWVEKHVIIFPL